MDTNPQSPDWWRLPALAAWIPLLAAGLVPDAAFVLLREAGRVTTITALVNNSWLVTFALSAYVGSFIAFRCREGGDSGAEAGDKGVQAGLLGLVAFMPFPLQDPSDLLRIPSPELRWLLLATLASKGMLWLYLTSLLLRYYLGGSAEVFRRMPTFLSGGRRRAPESAPASESKDTNNSGKGGPSSAEDDY